MSELFVVRDDRKRMLPLLSAKPPTLDWSNAQDAYLIMDEVDGELAPDAPEKDWPAFHLRHIPTPEVLIDDPDYRLNMFFIGYWMISARMRDALALDGKDVVYRPADVIGPPQVRALDYWAVAPVHHLDGVDPERSDIERFGDGPGGYWTLAYRDDRTPRVAFRPGLQAPAPLFYMDRTDWLMITRQAAERVRAAGIDDVFFDDPLPAYGSWMEAGA